MVWIDRYIVKTVIHMYATFVHFNALTFKAH